MDRVTDLDPLRNGSPRTEEGCEGDRKVFESSEVDSEDQVDDVKKKVTPVSTLTPITSGIDEGERCPVEDDFVLIGDSQEHNYFDLVVGAIEDIVMDEDFHGVHTGYLDKYWPAFSEDQTENLHVHFEMFKEYSQGISAFIENKLKSILENFDMEVFVELLTARLDLNGDIFDMLFTLIDFVKFRELLLDYRALREGKTIDLSPGISVKAIQADESP